MKSLFLAILIVTPLLAAADTLLVPDQSVSAEKYFSKCHLPGYQCTSKYFIDHELTSATPQLDSFLETIDLSNKTFVDSAQKKIQVIIQSEMISISQLDMILRLLEQMNSQNLAKPNRLAEEIKFIRAGLTTDLKIPVDELETDQVVYFKTLMTKNKFLKIKASYLSLPYTVTSYNHIPAHRTTKDQFNGSDENLISGACETAKLTTEIESVTWKVMSENSCGWTQSLTQSTSSVVTTVKENKNWFITGAVVLGAIILASKYDVTFQF